MRRFMTQEEFLALAAKLAREAGVESGQHQYFLSHQSRIWTTGAHFDLWNLKGREVLEAGPFFSYVPFALRENGNEVTVLEGDDPAVAPLEPLYQARGIPMIITDLFENFGAADLQRHRLPFPDAKFDVVNCWETMEHFNFNPVGFVREVRRILKPGGLAYMTVPNIAKLDWRLRLALGRPVGPLVSSYHEFYDYHGGKFLGWHWREYVLGEFVELFAREGFEIARAAHVLTFTHHDEMSAGRRLKRALGRLAFKLAPSTGTLCALTARNPARSSGV